LQTLLSGAIVFETPPDALTEAESPPGSNFTLYRDRKSAADSADPVRVFYQASFPGALHGLAIGTPVELRGIPIGRVSALRLEYDAASDEIRVPATLEIAPHRIARSATAFLDQLASLPLGELIGGMRDMVKHADAVVGSPELKRSVQQLDRTLADAGKFARDIRAQTAPLLGKLNSAADQLGSTL